MDRPYCRICDARCRLHFSNWSTKAPNSIKVPKKNSYSYSVLCMGKTYIYKCTSRARVNAIYSVETLTYLGCCTA